MEIRVASSPADMGPGLHETYEAEWSAFCLLYQKHVEVRQIDPGTPTLGPTLLGANIPSVILMGAMEYINKRMIEAWEKEFGRVGKIVVSPGFVN